ncbi:ferritin heavy chain-like [Orycteropus afer afer]|uniref:Ferritin heavy chain-like n=1 Tax=Orycteropus afer afer TaxID=1230840 RepID=A0AC54ZBM2_ORYAF|nr:ferritin heavy chain-like [Orycteropus afer afer]
MGTMPSQVHPNYEQELEAAINKQINLEFGASYVYLSMAYYFDREDVALKNFSTYFLGHWHEEQEHAEMLLRLQNQSRGRIQLHDIRKPELDDWGTGLNAMEYAFHLQRTINWSLLDIHEMAMEMGDPQLCHFLEHHFLFKQVRIINELSYHVNNLRQLRASGGSLDDYIFPNFTVSDSDKEN